MRVLLDFHHHALAESLLMLFEDRYGLDVWFPVGMDWYESGVWQFEKKFHEDRVARQYLLGIWGDAQVSDGVVVMKDRRHPGRELRGISYEHARDLSWDLVVSSLPDNDAGYASLAQDKGARFGVQLGNDQQQSRFDLASFILSSTTLPGYDEPSSWGKPVRYEGVPTVIYHQEFDLKTFAYEPEAEHDRRTIASFVNCFPETPIYHAFQSFARSTADEFDWRVYGSYGSAAPDEFAAGDISYVPDVARRMRRARIGWHTKYWSDGFGHVLHNWAALGRPLVGSARYYAGRLGGPLWVEGVTSFDVDSLNDAELVALLRRLRDDDDLWSSCSQAMARRFRELVDFDSEAEAIASLLDL